MPKKKFKQKISIAIFWGILIISFVFFATLIVLKAHGYQLNWKNWQIIKTGMIVLNGQPKDVNIRVNQKFLANFPEQISNLTPDNYNIVISKNDYQSWQKNIMVEPGQAEVYENIVLFLQKPIDKAVPENILPEKILTEYQNRSQDLKVAENEIFWQEKLISRFSNKVLSVSFYPDSQHIVFQQNREIRIIDLDGSNNVFLFNLDSSEPSVFTFRDDGKTIIYLDSGAIKAKAIR